MMAVLAGAGHSAAGPSVAVMILLAVAVIGVVVYGKIKYRYESRERCPTLNGPHDWTPPASDGWRLALWKRHTICRACGIEIGKPLEE